MSFKFTQYPKLMSSFEDPWQCIPIKAPTWKATEEVLVILVSENSMPPVGSVPGVGVGEGPVVSMMAAIRTPR